MRDLRYAVRLLLKAPVFTITAVLTLALCIGANTAIYTVVDRVLLRPLPYPEPERLAQVVTHFDRTGYDAVGQTGGQWEALAGGAKSVDVATTSGGVRSIGGEKGVGGKPREGAEAGGGGRLFPRARRPPGAPARVPRG